MAEDPTVELFRKRLAEARPVHEKRMEKVKAYREAYMGDAEQPKRKPTKRWRTRSNERHAFQQVQTLLPELVQPDADFEWEAVGPEDEAYADAVQRLHSFQLARDEYPIKRYDASHQASVDGFAPLKVTQERRVEKRLIRSLTSMPGEFVEQEVVAKNQPSITVIPAEDFMPQPARRWEDVGYVLHRVYLTLEQLKAKASKTDHTGKPIYKNLDQLDKLKEKKASKKTNNPLGAGDDEDRGDLFEVFEMHTAGKLAMIVERELCIRDSDHPYGFIPFVVATTQRAIDGMFGISELFGVVELQEIARTLRSMMFDALKLRLNPPIGVPTSESAATADIWPGKQIKSNNPQALTPYRFDILEPGQAEQAIRGVVELMERTTGINSSLSGNSNAGTATQAAIDQAASKSRVGLKLMLLDHAFAKCIEMMMQLNQRYFDFASKIRVLGEDGMAAWQSVAPEEVAAMFHVRPKNSSSRAIKDLRIERARGNLETFMTLLGQYVSPTTGRVIALDPMIEELADASGLEKAAVLVDPPQPLMDSATLSQAQPVG